MVLFSLSLLLMGGCRATRNSQQEITSAEIPTPTHSTVGYEEPVYNDSIDDDFEMIPVSKAQDILNKEKWYLTLQDAVIMALDNNKDIAVLRYLPDEKRSEIAIEYSDFDPNLNLGGQWQRTDQQVSNASSGSGVGNPEVQTDLFGAPPGLTDQLGITKKMETGTKTSLYYGSNYNMTNPTGNFVLVNPSWDSRLNFQLEQPIFKGRGRYVNRLGIEIANASYHVSRHEFQQTVSQTIRDVEVAYWDIIATETNLISRQIGVEESGKTLKVEESKLANGLNSISEVSQAREQFESLNAELSLARQLLSDSERNLRRLIGIRPEDGRRIVPTTDPLDFNNLPVWETGILSAIQQRPELEAQRSSIYAAKLSLDREANGLQHDLNAFAGYTINGLADSYDKSTSTLADNQYTDWSLGFRYERKLGQRAEKARTYQAQRKLLREKAQLRKLKHDIRMELHEAYQAIYSTKDVLQFQAKRKNAALQQLKAHEELYKKGQANLDLYLRSQLTHLNAMRDEKNAIANYNQALSRWAFATGNNLYQTGFAIEQPLQEIPVDQVFSGPQLRPVPAFQNDLPESEVEQILPLELNQLIQENN
jgi:outer membrane protein TolC